MSLDFGRGWPAKNGDALRLRPLSAGYKAVVKRCTGWLIAIAAALTLAACGGGGGGSASAPAPAPSVAGAVAPTAAPSPAPTGPSPSPLPAGLTLPAGFSGAIVAQVPTPGSWRSRRTATCGRHRRHDDRDRSRRATQRGHRLAADVRDDRRRAARGPDPRERHAVRGGSIRDLSIGYSPGAMTAGPVTKIASVRPAGASDHSTTSLAVAGGTLYAASAPRAMPAIRRSTRPAPRSRRSILRPER